MARTLAWARRVLDDDPEASAREAGLRHVRPDEPGFTRHRHGKGFTYRDAAGRTVRSKPTRARFAALVIPPAWTDVWICATADGHLQAVGRDDEGRKQYVYHPEWRRARDEAKYARVEAFGRILPRIRAAVTRDLEGGEGLERRRVLASVVRLLETTHVRVGNDEYARHNESFGLTTIRKRHVERAEGEEAVLEFPGKGAKPWHVEVEDPEVVDVIERCLETPGYELFKYFDADGAKRDVKSDDVNAYLREIADARVTAKDFRTWAGTVIAAVALEELERTCPEAAPEARVRDAVKLVAAELGNTPAISRSSYIHPRCLEPVEEVTASVASAMRARTEAHLREGDATLRPEEAAVLRYLERG